MSERKKKNIEKSWQYYRRRVRDENSCCCFGDNSNHTTFDDVVTTTKHENILVWNYKIVRCERVSSIRHRSCARLRSDRRVSVVTLTGEPNAQFYASRKTRTTTWTRAVRSYRCFFSLSLVLLELNRAVRNCGNHTAVQQPPGEIPIFSHSRTERSDETDDSGRV